MSTTDAAAEVHAEGKVLLAVAEGDPERQPDEALLSHIFSCPTCSATLKEMRQGLSVMNRKPGAAPAPSVDELLVSGGFESSDTDSYAAEQRARSLIWKLLIIGALLTIGMLWLRSSAASQV